jgi:hypothetical protein
MHWIDSDFLPDYAGTVERFIVNPHGKIDGLVLTYDRERTLLVHVPAHLDEVEALIRPGDAIRVRGVRPRGADMVAAVALIAADGRTIVDNGPGDDPKEKPDWPRAKSTTMEIAGAVRLSLHGPKGELRGALLDEGTVVRIGPKEADYFAKLMRPGAAIAVRGAGLETPHGRVVVPSEIGPKLCDLQHAKDAKHEPEHKQKPDVPTDPHRSVGAA